jgi:hypothetical protein
MKQLVAIGSTTLPVLVAAAGAGMRFLEFFAANIRNPDTRRADARIGGALTRGQVSEHRPADADEHEKLFERHRWKVVGPNPL